MAHSAALPEVGENTCLNWHDIVEGKRPFTVNMLSNNQHHFQPTLAQVLEKLPF
ncbi:MAG: hypothetical protein H6660_00030 [Ardenticatenaceae bacterium]|nr:hypothetical protein [Ardenticatenaceae bacterium]